MPRASRRNAAMVFKSGRRKRRSTTRLSSRCTAFSGADGETPLASPVQATNGDLYGTTASEGAHGYGTIFRIAPSGTLATLHNFCSKTGCADGVYPGAGLVQATDGNLYGTTAGGALGSYGTIFKITPSGALTTLYNFCSQSECTDGEKPLAGLVQATNGDLYGTTYSEGAMGSGTIFRIAPSGTLATLYSFCSQGGCSDGVYPEAGLVQATNGNLYGTTAGGALGNYGAIFKITPSGALTTLYNFCSQTGCTDGEYPYAGLVQTTDGNLYGTTQDGGVNGSGTIFRITPSGALTTLYKFCPQSGCPDGEYPDAALIQATDGNLYGTTEGGGGNGYGTIFRITPSGALTTLYNFCSQSGCTDGVEPRAGLIQATDGNLYGTTVGGGAGRRWDRLQAKRRSRTVC